MQNGFTVQPSTILAAGMREYWLIARLNADVQNKILQERLHFQETFGIEVVNQSPVCITLAGFQAQEAMEDTIIRWMQRLCSQHKSFPVTLNNYSGFPPHTIYVRVQDPAPFRMLAQQLRSVDEYVRSAACPPSRLVHQPAIPVAATLTASVYEKAMFYYSQRIFHATCQVQELELLARSYAFDACKTVQVFGLSNQANPYSEVA